MPLGQNFFMGLGYLIWDLGGPFVGSSLSCATSIPETELTAIWTNLSIAIYQLGFKHIWLKRDSLTVINWNNKLANVDICLHSSHVTHPLLLNIVRCISALETFPILHACREANQLADCLAKQLEHPVFYSVLPCKLCSRFGHSWYDRSASSPFLVFLCPRLHHATKKK